MLIQKIVASITVVALAAAPAASEIRIGTGASLDRAGIASAPIALPLSGITLLPLATQVIAPATTGAAPETAISNESLSGTSKVQAAQNPEAALPDTTDSTLSGESTWTNAEVRWSGAAARTQEVAVSAPTLAGSRPTSPLFRLASKIRRFQAAATLALPSVAFAAAPAATSVVQRIEPWALAGLALVGAVALDRVGGWAITRVARLRGLEERDVDGWRIGAHVAAVGAGLYGLLLAGGASAESMKTVLTLGGTTISFILTDTLTNLIHGVTFLVTRPFAIGDKVTVDGKTGTVKSLTLHGIIAATADGGMFTSEYSNLAAKPFVVYGAPRPLTVKSFLAGHNAPRFAGAVGDLWDSLGRGFWLGTAALASVIAAPYFLPALATGWLATGTSAAALGAIAWVTRYAEKALSAALARTAQRNNWHPEAVVLLQLALRILTWTIGVSAGMRVAGVSWATLGASLGLTTLMVGLATREFFGAIINGFLVKRRREFTVGDRLEVGTYEGAVEEMTKFRVVIRIDADQRVSIPYSMIRATTPVMHPKAGTK